MGKEAGMARLVVDNLENKRNNIPLTNQSILNPVIPLLSTERNSSNGLV
jgi:hypothetical protein